MEGMGLRGARGIFHCSGWSIDPLPESVIDALIADGRIFHCSGAVRVEEPPVSDYVHIFQGTTDSTSGMPLRLLERLLREVLSSFVA